MTSLSLPRWEPESLEGGAMVELSHGSTWYRVRTAEEGEGRKRRWE